MLENDRKKHCFAVFFFLKELTFDTKYDTIKCRKYYGLHSEKKMSRKSVAVLDVRSSQVTAVIGEAGVNRTFIFRGSYTQEYSGYDEEGFIDEEDFASAVLSAVAEVEHRSMEKIKEIVVGVPGDFIELLTKRYLISLQSGRKITAGDIATLYQNGLKDKVDGGEVIRRSNMYFITSDKRRIINPVGLKSDSLEGFLCYFVCKDYFMHTLDKILLGYGIRKVTYMPVSYAEAMYLIDSEARDGYAVLLDVDSLSHTFSVVCGNGILYQRSACEGGDHIAARLFERFSVPYYAMKDLLSKINLSGRDIPGTEVETYYERQLYKIDAERLRTAIKEELDVLCERINAYLEECPERTISYRPILMTGGGLSYIRGAQEHISKRLNKVVEVLSPSLPYYSKESQSSLLSVLDMAIKDKQKGSIVYKILNGFGGN